MSFLDWLKWRWKAEDDIEDEIRSHLAMATQERIADGADEEDARFAALKDFGNVTLTTEAARRVWRPWWVERALDVLTDGRHAFRVLAKSPGYSLLVIAVLALGIGLNAAVFSIFKSLVLKPLAGVADSGRLGVVLSRTTSGRQSPLSYPDFQYLRDHDRAFSGLAGSALAMVNVGLGNSGQRVVAEFVTGNYFQLFGVHAHLGRTLLPSDDVAPGKHPVVVLSGGLWQRAFGADPEIVGKTIHLNAMPLTVVGVAVSSFHGSIVSFDTEVFVPVMMVPEIGLTLQPTPQDLLHDRKAPIVMAFGWPRPGMSIANASAETAVLSTQLAAETPLEDFAQRLKVVPISQSPFGAQTYMLPAAIVLGLMGALLLLIVCANIAGLVLVRGISRRGEIAVRFALGAGRARILRLLSIENLMLAIPGAVSALLLLSYALPVMVSFSAGRAPVRTFFDLSIDRMVAGYAVVVACACALFFGFIPALRTSRINLASVINDDFSPRTATRSRLRSALVVSQVAVSVLLLVGAGLVTRSLNAARQADAGFDARNVISLSMDLKPNGYDENRARIFYQNLLDTVRADQGVESASLAAKYPMMLVEPDGQKIIVEGYQQRRDEDLILLFNVVSSDYFRTLRIPLVDGREFDRRDDPSSLPVAIVNETFARRFWQGPANAMGKRLRTASGEWRTVIGVARDVKYARINEAPRPYVYLPFFQSYMPNMMLHARGPAGAARLIEETRREVQRLDPELPILEAKTLSEQASAALTIFEMTAGMLVLFGVAAMGLAAMGVYGLVSYNVKQSTHEIGIRMALGAGRTAVVRRFLGRGLWLGATGAVIGIVVSYGATRLLANVLYGVSATDAVSFISACALVLGTALIATFVPAARAARTNPMSALRRQ